MNWLAVALSLGKLLYSSTELGHSRELIPHDESRHTWEYSSAVQRKKLAQCIGCS
jgi:hypothetical protein